MIIEEVAANERIVWARLIHRGPVHTVLDIKLEGDKKRFFGRHKETMIKHRNGRWYNPLDFERHINALIEIKDRKVFFRPQVIYRVENGDSNVLKFHISSTNEEATEYFEKIKQKVISNE